MIWIILATMLAWSFCLTRRYKVYLDRILATVTAHIEGFKGELAQFETARNKTARQIDEWPDKVGHLEGRVAELEEKVKALLARPDYRSQETSRAALKELLRG